jgi:hypothetical protein
MVYVAALAINILMEKFAVILKINKKLFLNLD